MHRHTRPLARTLIRARNAQTGWVVGALLTSLGLAALSSNFASGRTGAWTIGSLVVLAGASACLAFALRRARPVE